MTSDDIRRESMRIMYSDTTIPSGEAGVFVGDAPYYRPCFIPFRDFLVVRPLKPALSSILEVIMQDDKDHPNMEGRAIVLRVGPGLQTGRKYQRKGIYGPLDIQVGDLVAYEGHKTYPRDPGSSNLIMQASDCIVFEFEDGETLEQYMARERLAFEDSTVTRAVGSRSGLRTGSKTYEGVNHG
jgi:hypothetical protein